MLSAYYLDRTEVTVGAYRRCVELGRCTEPPYASGGQRFDRPDYPVTLVTGTTPTTTAASSVGAFPRKPNGSAPRAAPKVGSFRGATSTTSALCNHGELGIDNGPFGLENTDDSDGFLELAPVGSFPAGRTPDGIDDIAGNVEEWVADAIDDMFQRPLRRGQRSESQRGRERPFSGACAGGATKRAPPSLRGATRTFRPGHRARSLIAVSAACIPRYGEL